MAAATWSTQQLAEFVAAVSAAESEPAAALAAVERAAEALDSDAAAIVGGGKVLATVGFPRGTAPVADLEAVKSGRGDCSLEVPGVGPCAATAATLEHPPGATLVVARAGVDGLTTEEAGLLRGMARVASLTMRMQRLLDGERVARKELERFVREQAALRRVATLVAEAASADAVFAAVAEEVGRVAGADVALVARYADDAIEFVGGWSNDGDISFVGRKVQLGGNNVTSAVFETNAPARVDYRPDDVSPATALAREWASSSAGAPISVEGRLWGVMIVGSRHGDALPSGVEHELADFTELVATAVANAQTREDLRVIADEQAALRRVATLVAEGASPEEIFTAVVDEVARILGLERIEMARYEADGTATVIAASGDHPFPPGSRWALDGPSLLLLVQETGRAVRIDDYGDLPGTVAAVAREAGFRSAIGAPIIVGGRTWGAIIAISTEPEPIPDRWESRLAQFTDLVATAIANAQARDELREVADDQAALRRVATLVARGAAPGEIFDAVTEEIHGLLQADETGLSRYDPDGLWTVLAVRGATTDLIPVGFRLDPGASMPGMAELLSGRSVRVDAPPAGTAVDDLIRAEQMQAWVAAPIVLMKRTWGQVAVFSRQGPLPAGTEERLADFAELIATAIANAQAREELRGVADEQAALRRVATLVARGLPAAEIFDAVAKETRAVLGVDSVALLRPESDGTVMVLAVDSAHPEPHGIPVGGRFTPEPNGVIEPVLRTGRPSRIDAPEGDVGRMAQLLRAGGNRGAVGAPIVVDGRPWGVMLAVWKQEGVMQAGGEERLVQFTELVATAVANTQAQAELTASRARIIATADETRRRIERDLHDGAQQRLVTLGLRLRAAQAAVPPELEELAAELDDVARGLSSALDELREFARGIHPAILVEGGLARALRSLARRSAVPVELDVHAGTSLPEPIEVAVYYVVSEALANVAKHAEASTAAVDVEPIDGVVRVSVRDDGIGGADFAPGSGLVGLKDRVEALGGRISLESQRGAGTAIEVELPLPAESE